MFYRISEASDGPFLFAVCLLVIILASAPPLRESFCTSAPGLVRLPFCASPLEQVSLSFLYISSKSNKKMPKSIATAQVVLGHGASNLSAAQAVDRQILVIDRPVILPELFSCKEGDDVELCLFVHRQRIKPVVSPPVTQLSTPSREDSSESRSSNVTEC